MRGIQIRVIRSLALVSLCVAGCSPAVFVAVEPVELRTTVPRPVMFEVLARDAVSQGYIMDAVDPMNGNFQVHSRAMGRPPRRPSRQPARGALRTNLFIVQVAEGGVRVSAIGRHVRPDGTMHPTLAAEFGQFSEMIRQRATILGATFVPIPQPPSGYQPPPQQMPPGQYPPPQLPPPGQHPQQPPQYPPQQPQQQERSPAQNLGRPY
jgi:hypothetical protein